MKYIKFGPFFIVLTFSITAFGQKSVEVKEEVASLSLGERTGYTVSLGDKSEKDTQKALKTWLGDLQKKVSVDETGKREFKVTNISIPAFGEVPINIYFLFSDKKKELFVTGFFEINGAFVSATTNPEMVKECVTMMQKFAYRIEKNAIEEKALLAIKELEKRNDEQTSLEKKNKQLNDQIADWNESIKKAESELESNKKSQESKKSEIAEQQKIVEEIQKELKKYEKY